MRQDRKNFMSKHTVKEDIRTPITNLYLYDSTKSLEDKIINILKRQPQKSATRTKISSCLSNNFLAKDITQALQKLSDSGDIKVEIVRKPGSEQKGRPLQLVSLTNFKTSDY
jgi:hypothetical protein